MSTTRSTLLVVEMSRLAGLLADLCPTAGLSQGASEVVLHLPAQTLRIPVLAPYLLSREVTWGLHRVSLSDALVLLPWDEALADRVASLAPGLPQPPARAGLRAPFWISAEPASTWAEPRPPQLPFDPDCAVVDVWTTDRGGLGELLWESEPALKHLSQLLKDHGGVRGYGDSNGGEVILEFWPSRSPDWPP